MDKEDYVWIDVLVTTVTIAVLLFVFIDRREQDSSNRKHELILKCMEQDTAINCAAAFTTGVLRR